MRRRPRSGGGVEACDWKYWTTGLDWTGSLVSCLGSHHLLSRWTSHQSPTGETGRLCLSDDQSERRVRLLLTAHSLRRRPQNSQDPASMDFIKSLPDGLPWHELCQRVDDYKRKYYPSSATTGATTDAADGGRIFMTSHLLSFLTRRGRAGADHETMAAIRSKLRAVDALHIPKLRVDGSGVVRDWNRALVDLTGVERSAAVGRGYADLLDERVPGLSDGYKRAAVEWLGSAADAGSPDGSDREANRRAYLFPLPLPLDHDESFDLSRDVNQGGGYVELLVARVDRLPEMFPKMIDLPEFSPTWLPIGSGRLSMKCFKR